MCWQSWLKSPPGRMGTPILIQNVLRCARKISSLLGAELVRPTAVGSASTGSSFSCTYSVGVYPGSAKSTESLE